MGRLLRTAPGMRERSPGVWELIAEAGRDPVTGKRRQISRSFRGTLTDAKKARAALVVELGKGRHSGTGATVDHLFGEWIVELKRKGRSPNTIHGYKRNYEHNIRAALGSKPVTKVSTKMLTDLYGAHQARGLAPGSVYQIHACLSSMFTQACRWGWRDSNPAQWADPPSIPNRAPVVPTPDQVMGLIREAQQSRRPEMARAIFVAATTGMRRAELCALRCARDIDWDASVATVAWSILELPGQPLSEMPTKNRRERPVALDELTLGMLRAQVEHMRERAETAGAELVPDAYIFSDAVDASEPWRPGSITLYFSRLRRRLGLEHLDFHYLRKFMETYGQNLGFSPLQVAMRAGHDPSVAAKHYTGHLEEVDRKLATAVASLLVPSAKPGGLPSTTISAS
jgi:integrase